MRVASSFQFTRNRERGSVIFLVLGVAASYLAVAERMFWGGEVSGLFLATEGEWSVL